MNQLKIRGYGHAILQLYNYREELQCDATRTQANTSRIPLHGNHGGRRELYEWRCEKTRESSLHESSLRESPYRRLPSQLDRLKYTLFIDKSPKMTKN